MQHPKNRLIERLKSLGLPAPKFDTRNTGPEHEPLFMSDVLVDGEVYGTGQGEKKRDAERKASEEALLYLDQAHAQERAETEDALVGAFDGPWPIFPEILAATLQVANSRVENRLKGDVAVAEVQRLALQLYKGSLESLGEVVEVEEEGAKS